jgi:hypothetical protein
MAARYARFYRHNLWEKIHAQDFIAKMFGKESTHVVFMPQRLAINPHAGFLCHNVWR